jgi:hypothetical protein
MSCLGLMEFAEKGPAHVSAHCENSYNSLPLSGVNYARISKGARKCEMLEGAGDELHSAPSSPNREIGPAK